jgi:hypothetical protein
VEAEHAEYKEFSSTLATGLVKGITIALHANLHRVGYSSVIYNSNSLAFAHILIVFNFDSLVYSFLTLRTAVLYSTQKTFLSNCLQTDIYTQVLRWLGVGW